MRVRTLVVSLFIAALAIASASAQNTPRTTAPTAPAAPAAPTAQAPPPPPPPPPPGPGQGQASAAWRNGQSVNIKVEATITDQVGNGTPVKKTVAVVVAEGQTGSVRTLSTFTTGAIGNVPLNMDAEARLLNDGKLRLSLRLQYDLPSNASLGRPGGGGGGSEERQPAKTSIVESVNIILENGKPVVAAQSADPVSDRQVVLEVKATVLR